MESTVSIDLSSCELHWLAAAFGIANLPISLPVSTLSELNKAEEDLISRKLVRKERSTSWQIDPTVAIFLQWIMNGHQHWVFNLFERTGQTDEISLFLLNHLALLILPTENNTLRLTACENLNIALDKWQSTIKLPTLFEKEKIPQWDIPQPLTVIRSIWKNSPFMKSVANPDFITWACGLDWAGEWALVKEDKRFSRYIVAVGYQSVWGGSYQPGRPGEFPLGSFAMNELIGTFIAER